MESTSNNTNKGITIQILEDSVVIKENDKTINLGTTISSIGLWSDFLELDPKTYQPIPPGPLEIIDHGQMIIHDCSEFASFASCSSECFSVQTDDLVIHFGADYIRVYEEHDWMEDLPLIFGMIDPAVEKQAVLKLAEILSIPEPPLHSKAVDILLYNPDLAVERQAYYKTMISNRYINFGLPDILHPNTTKSKINRSVQIQPIQVK